MRKGEDLTTFLVPNVNIRSLNLPDAQGPARHVAGKLYLYRAICRCVHFLPFSEFITFFQTFCETTCTTHFGAKPEPRQDKNTTRNKSTHSSIPPNWDSNPRSQCSGSRRQYTVETTATDFGVVNYNINNSAVWLFHRGVCVLR